MGEVVWLDDAVDDKDHLALCRRPRLVGGSASHANFHLEGLSTLEAGVGAAVGGAGENTGGDVITDCRDASETDFGRLAMGSVS